MATRRNPVTAPPAQPPRYGLLAAAPIADDANLDWTAGYEYLPEQCAGGGRVALGCGLGVAVDADNNPAVVTVDPFVVFAGDRCSALSFQSRDFEGRARRQLAGVESFEVAEELWTGALTDDATPATHAYLAQAGSDVVTSGATSEVGALACVEQALGKALTGKRGMVHMTLQVLTVLVSSSALYREGNLWLTPAGNIVVADAGYTGSGPGAPPGVAPGTSQWIYGTGMVGIRRGPVEIVPGTFTEALDRATNTIEFMAQRVYGATFEPCAHVAAEVDLGVCA